MPKKSLKGNAWILALGLTMSLIAPSLAEAQQGGLFPNIGVRRSRTTCAAEDPVYKLYRHEFFGYHPTCWRRFPAGWGCPSPEAPNAVAAFKQFPRDKPLDLEGEEDDPNTGAMDDNGGGNGGAKGNRPSPNPSDLPLPDGDASPFDLDAKPKPPAASPSRPSAATPTPSGNPLTPTASRSEAEAAEEPLLALPEPPSNNPGRPFAPKPAPTLPGSGSFDDPDPAAYHPEEQPKPAKRQTLLSTLFGGFGKPRR